ncbi:MAG TPA: hypothetical protein VNF46_04800 [Gammaproteobacteria bacterium]|nr:hypothetical protein [Gammaproteobacteria bacterium]
MAWFKTRAGESQTRINAALREYVTKHCKET